MKNMNNISRVLKKIMADKNIDHNFDELINGALKDPDVQSFVAKNKDHLNRDFLQKSAANIYEYVNQKRLYQQQHDTVVAGYQPVLILNDGLIDVSYRPTAETIKSQRTKQSQRRLVFVELPDSLRKARLEDYERTPGRKAALSEALLFSANYSQGKKMKGLYLSGNFGVGKTYLLAAIANSLIADDHSVVLVHVPTFAANIRERIADNSVVTELNRLKTAEVLMLDDIGAESVTSFIRDDVLGVILQYRMETQLPTFFSSNFSLDELEHHFAETKGGLEEPVKAKRIMERIKFLAKEVIVQGENRRHLN